MKLKSGRFLKGSKKYPTSFVVMEWIKVQTRDTESDTIKEVNMKIPVTKQQRYVYTRNTTNVNISNQNVQPWKDLL